MRATHVIALLLAIGGTAGAQDGVKTWDFQSATLVYDLNRYNDRSFKGDQRELSRFTLPLEIASK